MFRNNIFGRFYKYHRNSFFSIKLMNYWILQVFVLGLSDGIFLSGVMLRKLRVLFLKNLLILIKHSLEFLFKFSIDWAHYVGLIIPHHIVWTW